MKPYSNKIQYSESHLPAYPILLFDGVCNLCNAAVQTIIKADRQAVFRFASLQSETGQQLMQQYGIPFETTSDPASIVLIDGKQAYTHSSAALHTARKIGGAWSILFVFMLVPKPLRDRAYTFIANNRYRWFGKKDSCMIPTPELRERFWTFSLMSLLENVQTMPRCVRLW